MGLTKAVVTGCAERESVSVAPDVLHCLTHLEGVAGSAGDGDVTGRDVRTLGDETETPNLAATPNRSRWRTAGGRWPGASSIPCVSVSKRSEASKRDQTSKRARHHHQPRRTREFQPWSLHQCTLQPVSKCSVYVSRYVSTPVPRSLPLESCLFHVCAKRPSGSPLVGLAR